MQISPEQFQAFDAQAEQARRDGVAKALERDWTAGWRALSAAQREQRVDLLIKLCQGLDDESRQLESRVNSVFIRFDAQVRKEDEREIFYRLITDRSRPLALRLERVQAWLGLD